MRRMLLAVPLLLILAACGQRPSDETGGGAPAADPLRGKTFLATAVTEDGKPHPLVADLSIEFTDDGRVIARGGCNMMQGQVDTSDGKIAVDQLATTDMGCAQELLDEDKFVADVLGGTPSWQLADDTLTITAGTTVVEMAPRELVHPDRDLAGTTWELDTIVDGQVASSLPAGAQPVTLRFDGTKVTADTHCNGVAAEYTVSGDTITFDLGMMTKMACAPEIMQGENAVVDAMAGTAKYEITADKLTLTSESGKGIQLHAQ